MICHETQNETLPGRCHVRLRHGASSTSAQEVMNVGLLQNTSSQHFHQPRLIRRDGQSKKMNKASNRKRSNIPETSISGNQWPGERVEAIATLIGNTPLLRIEYELDGIGNHVYAKYESENMTGSIKDRMAIHTIRSAYQSGALKPGTRLSKPAAGTREFRLRQSARH